MRIQKRSRHARMSAYTRIVLASLCGAALAGCHLRAPAPPRLTRDRPLAALEEVAGWPGAEDAVLFTLATQYFASRRDQDGFAWFSAASERQPQRPLLLALSGLFQARMADQVPLLSRVVVSRSCVSGRLSAVF